MVHKKRKGIHVRGSEEEYKNTIYNLFGPQNWVRRDPVHEVAMI